MKKVKISKNKVVLVDDSDFKLVNSYRWYAEKHRSTYYAYNSVRKGNITEHSSMHRLIMDAEDGQQVDHKNGDGLDNRRENLRICTNVQNQGNRKTSTHYGGNTCSSTFKGVSWHKPANKWTAQICKEKVKRHLGCFILEEDAARAYDKAAKEYFGEFALLNFPEDWTN